MKTKFPELDPKKLSTCSLTNRVSLVSESDFARPWTPGAGLSELLARLPGFLAANDLKAVIAAVVCAARARKTVILGMGGHVVKTGLAPLLTDLMDRGVISLFAVNGSVIVHDTEIALIGKTSENVAAALPEGRFGTARETAEFLCRAVQDAEARKIGLGRAVGEALLSEGAPFAERSLLASAARRGVPVTVHEAFGTDVWHIHPGFDPAACGAATHRDFLAFAGAVATLSQGVIINAGSAVILPEVFLKALSLSRNLGHRVTGFTAVNLDMVRQYRPMQNVVGRPVSEGGQGIHITGHHEIMIPLLCAGIVEGLEARE
ncbi:MAG: hypothetical protein AB1921_15540 [Thermodesulfobacteriota bacterium]